jgi:DNA-binding protein H-NS
MPNPKVKNMPRKQQMAVKASMAEEAAKKGSSAKMMKKTSPALAKLSASCKAAAKRKFKVYPSAYANMWASKTQKAGKC